MREEQLSYINKKLLKQVEVARRQKALEAEVRYCRILKKKVTVLKEYLDYKHRSCKGEAGTIYCENIIDCYQNNIKCKYSGISPLYPDPFGYEECEADLEKTV
jgi:hypothetical protein